MKLKVQFLLLFLLPFTMVKAANIITDAGTGITGTVIDSVSQKPVDYATVSVFDQASNKVVNGTVTATDGKFTIDKLPAGTCRLRIVWRLICTET